MSDIKFVDGLFIKAPNENAPDFVKAAISIKRSALITWLTEQEGDWINLDAKESRAGKWYISVNDFKPSKQDTTAAQNQPPQGSNQGQQAHKPTIDQDNDFGDEIPW